MTVRGLNHVTLAVTDLEISVAFYRDLLGLSLKAVWPEGAYFKAGALWLCLSRDEAAASASRNDYTHIAFDVAAEDFDALAARIASGAKIWKDNKSEGQSLYFSDPDGHKLEIHVGSLGSRLDHYRAHPDKGVTVLDG